VFSRRFIRFALAARCSVSFLRFSLFNNDSIYSCLLSIAGADKVIPAETAGCFIVADREER